MRPFVNLSQARGADVRVDLRGHQALVPQQLLHAANISAPVQQMRREAMPQRVRTGSGIQVGLHDVLFQHSADTASGHPHQR